MADSTIAISSDSSNERVGSPPSWVILFGDIPTVIPSTSVVAPETSTIVPVISSAASMVETTLVASPTGLSISPFLCTDSSEALDSSDGPSLQDPFVATVARFIDARKLAWRHASPRSSDHHSSSFSSSLDSSPVHSSGLDAPNQAHSGSLTRDVSPRLCYPPRRAP
ncbi:hypothetical protein Tco_1578547 [Tanacetum coccineum]